MVKLGEGAIGRGPEKTALNGGDQIKESEMDGECGTQEIEMREKGQNFGRGT